MPLDTRYFGGEGGGGCWWLSRLALKSSTEQKTAHKRSAFRLPSRYSSAQYVEYLGKSEAILKIKALYYIIVYVYQKVEL